MVLSKLPVQCEYPPMPYLEHVLSHAAKAGETYLWLWKHANEDHICQLPSSKLADVTQMSKARFKHDLRSLCREGLISYTEVEDLIEIELVTWGDVVDEVY